jgi:uncharacterized protein YndB with AHSA1/START domain
MITVETTINAPIEKVWKCWTTPEDIMQWNVPFDDWQTLLVENDFKEDGKFLYRMAAKDASAGFDFTGKYDKVITNKLIESTLNDGRKVINVFAENNNSTTLTETFDPETQTPLDVQKEFCQTVLDTFKKYTENQKD